MNWRDLVLTMYSMYNENSAGKEEHFIKIIPTNREMPTPEKYLVKSAMPNKKASKLKKKRGY